MSDASLTLASASPQRRAILARLGIDFAVRPTGVAERSEGEPSEVARENALRKARAAAREARAGELVLGVDTLVALPPRIYGKPPDETAARATLQALAGRPHTVYSGLALIEDGRELVTLAATEVRMRECDEQLLDWYVGTGEWRGRAGGYAIQGVGAALVREIHGDYENVVGLPLATLLDVCPQLLQMRCQPY